MEPLKPEVRVRQVEGLADDVRALTRPVAQQIRTVLTPWEWRAVTKVYLTGAGDSYHAACAAEMAFAAIAAVTCAPLAQRLLDYGAAWMRPAAPQQTLVVAHGKASWMEEVIEKMEASTRVVPLLHYYPVRTDVEEMWEEGHVLLGFDAEERLIQKLPHQFAEKIVWGSRYPHHDTTSAWDAIQTLTQAQVDEPTIARMLGGNAAVQFGVQLVQKIGA